MMTKGVLYIATGARRFTLESIRSARSLRDRLPDVDVTLFTDFLHEGMGGDYSVFSNVVVHPEMVALDQPSKVDWGRNLLLRIYALQRTPYHHTLHLDADTMVLDDRIGRAFDLLGEHELLLCPASKATSRSAAMINVPIYYTGIFGYDIRSPKVVDLLKAWERTFKDCLTARNSDQLFSKAKDLVSLDKNDRYFLLSTDQYAFSRHLRPDYNPKDLKVWEFDPDLWNHHTPFDHPGIIVQANPLGKFDSDILNSYGHFHPFRSTFVRTFLGYNADERADLSDVIRKYVVPDHKYKSGHGLRTDGNIFEKPDPALALFRQRIEPHISRAVRDIFFKRSNARRGMNLQLYGWGYVLKGQTLTGTLPTRRSKGVSASA